MSLSAVKSATNEIHGKLCQASIIPAMVCVWFPVVIM